MKKTKLFRIILLILVSGLAIPSSSWGQDEKEVLAGVDSTGNKTIIAVVDADDSTVKKIRVHSPGKAALRSAILPGLGQIYNRKYWKLPIVYGALGTSAGVFFYNLKNYRDTRFAYRVKYNMREYGTDSALFGKIRRELQPLSEASLRSYRDQFRRDIDYSVLFFLLLWGLNVVDAAVDAHLKGFDVSPDLSFRIKPGRSEMAGTTGMSLVFNLGKKPASRTRLLPTHF